MSASLSRFTPSNLPAIVLERLFVARESLLDDLLDRVEGAATSSERNHSLVVGPRGAGKTHLMSLINHRVDQMAERDVAVQAAWLLEDPYLIASYRDLLGKIVDAVGGLRERGASVDELEQQLVDAFADRGVIVVIVENFDQVLHAIGEDGQHRLRSFIQSESALLLMATTIAVTRDLNDAAWPFYGFFTTDLLRPLSVDEAAEMLRRIASESGDDALVAYLDTDEGRARLHAIEHLAGGQPRVWALLASALTVSGLSELVGLLLIELDALTPYYQEQMARLSPLQRRTVAELIEAESAVTVSDLAERVGIDQRTIAKTLSELRQRQWVVVSSSPFTAWVDRRRTFYELGEPLARIAFQIKAARSTPVELIIDFMKMWFDPDALDDLGGHVDKMYVTALKREYTSDAVGSVVRGLRGLPQFRVPSVELLEQIDDALHDLASRDPAGLLSLPVALRIAIEERLADPDGDDLNESLDRLRSEIVGAALTELGNIPQTRSAAWIARVERWLEVADHRADPLGRMVRLFSANWRHDEARAAVDAVERLLGAEHIEALTARSSLAIGLWAAGRVDEAIEIEERVVREFGQQLGVDHPDTLTAWSNLASSYHSAGRFGEAIEITERIARQRENSLGVDHRDTLTSWNNLARSYSSGGRLGDAIEIDERVARQREDSLGVDHPDTLTSWNNLATSYLSVGRLSEAVETAERVARHGEKLLSGDDPRVLMSWGNLASSYRLAGRFGDAIEIEERVVRELGALLGVGHPQMLTAWGNLAASYRSAGRVDEAVEIEKRVVQQREEVLGAEHPATLTSRANLANSYRSAGRVDDAIEIEERVVHQFEDVLGVEHPDTLTAWATLAASYRSAGRVDEAVEIEARTTSSAR